MSPSDSQDRPQTTDSSSLASAFTKQRSAAAVAELDSAVAAVATRDDPSALTQVLETIRPLVLRYCRARIPREDIAADVAQEVCSAVMTALPGYQDEGRPFMGFVYRIASHEVAAAFRRIGGRAEGTSEVPNTVIAVGEDEQREQVKSALATLPANHREILILRLVVGLSPEETAAAVGSTAAAIRVAQHRALAKLKSQVGRQATDDTIRRVRELLEQSSLGTSSSRAIQERISADRVQRVLQRATDLAPGVTVETAQESDSSGYEKGDQHGEHDPGRSR